VALLIALPLLSFFGNFLLAILDVGVAILIELKSLVAWSEETDLLPNAGNYAFSRTFLFFVIRPVECCDPVCLWIVSDHSKVLNTRTRLTTRADHQADAGTDPLLLHTRKDVFAHGFPS